MRQIWSIWIKKVTNPSWMSKTVLSTEQHRDKTSSPILHSVQERIFGLCIYQTLGEKKQLEILHIFFFLSFIKCFMFLSCYLKIYIH